jgi:hypothetical protein
MLRPAGLTLAKVKFEVPIYGGTVQAFSDKNELIKTYNKLSSIEKQNSSPFPEVDCSGMVFPTLSKDGVLNFLVGVFDNDMLTLVHECGHLAIFICGQTMLEITQDTSEPFCYLLEYLVRRCKPLLTTATAE